MWPETIGSAETMGGGGFPTLGVLYYIGVISGLLQECIGLMVS